MTNNDDIESPVRLGLSKNKLDQNEELGKPIEEFLQDPQFSPTGDPLPIGDNDFTDATNDISKKAKKTLGSYLSQKTKKNDYAVSSTTTTTNSVNARGSEISPAEGNDSSQNVFAKIADVSSDIESSGLGIHKNDKKKNQSTFFSQKQIDDVLVKVGQTKDKNGHTLLSSVPYDGTPDNDEDKGTILLNSIYQNLTEGNRHSADYNNSFIKENGNNTDDLSVEFNSTDGLFTLQRKLGEFDKDQKSITSKNLVEKIANILANTSNDFNKSQGTINFLTDEQKSKLSKVYPWNTSEGLTSNSRDWTFEQQFSKDRFSGSSPGSLELVTQGYLILLAHAMTIKSKIQSLKKNRFVALNDKQALITTLTNNDSGDTSLLSYGKRESRIYWENDKDKEYFSRLASLDYDFDKCFSVGMSTFLGISEDDEKSLENNSVGVKTSQQILAKSILMNSSPGFYLSIIRAMSKSITNDSGFQLSGETSYSITESKIYKFILTIAALGNTEIRSRLGMRDVTPSERLLSKEASRYISPSTLSLGVVVATNVNNTAVKDSTMALGGGLLGTFRKHVSRWSPIGTYDAAPSANPLSLHTFYAAQKTPVGVGLASTTPIGIRGLKPTRENVEIIEDALEAEYMPFYVHDLRTHEILSMPAFITDFGETFTPTYNSVQGIGRQDPVKIYQNTERSVRIAFKLVAYNEEDFDHLWLTVNKFIAMCYPQYSAGRVRSDGFKNFIQPFSQVQAASPMIRLRLGDVLKSNYSKFGVARLFGVNSSAISASEQEKENIASKAKEINKAVADKLSLAGNISSAVALTAAKSIGNAMGVANAKTDKLGSIASNVLYDEGSESQKITNYISNDQANDVRTGARTLVDNQLKYNQIASAVASFDQKMPESDFFKKENNAIVRSFESTSGRGVAGFITSLDLNYEGATWETKIGKKAPKMVTIAMGFTPVTDLPLGLDYDGNMRNPSHPVGKFAGSFGDVYDDIVDLGPSLAAKDFNNSILSRKLKGGQIAADIATSAAFAADDSTK